MWKLILILFVSIAFFPNAIQSQEQVTDNDQIRLVTKSFSKFWNEKDVEGLVNIFSVQGSQLTSSGTFLQGHESLRQSFTRAFKSPEYAASKTESVIVGVNLLSDGVAYADTKWKSSGITDADGKLHQERNGRSIFLLKKIDSKWKVIALRSMRLPSGMK